MVYGSPKTTPGGKALGFYSSQVLDIAKSGTVGDRGEETANHIKVIVEKNKVAPPFRKAEFDIRFGEGIDKASELLLVGVERGIIEKAGSFFKYKGKTLAQGQEKAREIIDNLKFHFHCQYDEKDSIGKRYRRQDAIGTPYCVTVDHQTLEDNCVTLRNRDTMQQERVAISELNNIIADRVSITSLLKTLQ